MKITKDIRNQMIKLRKKGLSYSEIITKLKVSKWACMTYLKHIEIDRSWIEKEWRKAEEEAKKILKEYGFSHIVNLNSICSNPPYWDYYCEKGDKKWLIDVTINEKKDVIDKFSRGLKDYNLAILLKEKDDEWKFIEIKLKEIKW